MRFAANPTWTGQRTRAGGRAHVETGTPKGRLRTDEHAVGFVEVTVNGPKTWSLGAALHPEIAKVHDARLRRPPDWIKPPQPEPYRAASARNLGIGF